MQQSTYSQKATTRTAPTHLVTSAVAIETLLWLLRQW